MGAMIQWVASPEKYQTNGTRRRLNATVGALLVLEVAETFDDRWTWMVLSVGEYALVNGWQDEGVGATEVEAKANAVIVAKRLLRDALKALE